MQFTSNHFLLQFTSNKPSASYKSYPSLSLSLSLSLMENGNQPLLSSSREVNQEQEHQLQSLPVATHTSSTATFNADAADIPPIKSPVDFYRAFLTESKKLWYLAGPAIFTSLCQYSLGAVTQVFLGQVGTLDLAAFSMENSVIAGFSLGIMVPSTVNITIHTVNNIDSLYQLIFFVYISTLTKLNFNSSEWEAHSKHYVGKRLEQDRLIC